MIKAIIFDLDGTLLDTSYDIQRVLNESLEKFSLPAISHKQTLEYIGNGARLLVERAAGRENAGVVPEIYADYVVRFACCDNSLTKLFKGEEAALNKLTADGIRLAIISNKPQLATENVYSQYLAKFGFCEVLGQTEYFPLKPNPASTLAVLERLGVKKSECLYVGDGETDVQCAASAGLRCISALWGYRSREQLEKAGAKEFASSFDELIKMVK